MSRVILCQQRGKPSARRRAARTAVQEPGCEGLPYLSMWYGVQSAAGSAAATPAPLASRPQRACSPLSLRTACDGKALPFQLSTRVMLALTARCGGGQRIGSRVCEAAAAGRTAVNSMYEDRALFGPAGFLGPAAFLPLPAGCHSGCLRGGFFSDV